MVVVPALRQRCGRRQWALLFRLPFEQGLENAGGEMVEPSFHALDGSCASARSKGAAGGMNQQQEEGRIEEVW